MEHTVILVTHIVGGVGGVLLGPFAVARLYGGTAGWTASAYHLAVALVCASAVGLAMLDFARLWWFILVAAGSYAFAARAILAIRAGRAGWQSRAVRGFGGAYIALWTAIVVVGIPEQPIVWALPSLVGIPALEWFAARLGGRRRAGSVDRTTN